MNSLEILKNITLKNNLKCPKLTVIKSNTPIAFCVNFFGLKYIFITSYINEHKNREAVEGVLAHELAHLNRHHGLCRLFSLWAFFLIVAWGAALGMIAYVGITKFIIGFSVWIAYSITLRQQEYDADYHAAIYTNKISVIKALEEFVTEKKSNFFSSHPSKKERIKELLRLDYLSAK